MRRFNVSREQPLKIMKELDAFPKIEPCYVETNARSGLVSIVMIICITTLLVSEIRSYTDYEFVYEYGVDMDSSSALKINIDMTVASPCAVIGADLLDITGKHSIDHDNNLQETDTVFELNKEQLRHQDQHRPLNKYLQEKYHSMHESIWDMGYDFYSTVFPDSNPDEAKPKNACRLRGFLSARKLSGNFHITLGKPIQMFGGGHAHLSLFGEFESFNFSHRIHHFSFGEQAMGKIYPLDGDEHVTEHANHLYQYFLKVVPTKINTKYAKVDTYQYSVTEMDRPLDHGSGSHGVPGIYFKYDISPVKVYVEQRYKPLWTFLIRLCGIVGGIFACTGILNSLFEAVVEIICCRFKIGKSLDKDKSLAPVEKTSIVNPNQDSNGFASHPLMPINVTDHSSNTS